MDVVKSEFVICDSQSIDLLGRATKLFEPKTRASNPTLGDLNFTGV